MIFFKLYQQKIFSEILKKVYDLKKADLPNELAEHDISGFYCSKKFLLRNNYFNLPFNFYSALKLTDDNFQIYFRKLNEISKKTKKNVSLKIFNDYCEINKRHIANNPIIHLPNNYDAFFEKLSVNLKSNIKRSKNKLVREKIQIITSSQHAVLKNFYNNIFVVQYIRKHLMVFQPYNLLRLLFKANILRVFVAIKDEHILSGILCMNDGNVLHYNWGASLNYKNLSLGTLLIDHAIRHAIENNYQYFDLGSTPLTDTNLFNYKIRWGAQNYPVYEYYTLKSTQNLDLNNSLLAFRKLYSHIPICILKKTVPKIIPWLVR